MDEYKERSEPKPNEKEQFIIGDVGNQLLKKIIPGFDPLKNKYSDQQATIVGWVWKLPSLEAIKE